MKDTIDRQAAIDAVNTALFPKINTAKDAEKALRALPSAQPERRWIPFTGHVPESDEKELYPGYDFILDGKLPEDGQRILVTIKKPGHESVQADEFYMDLTECYLDSGYEIRTEAIAWMPLPEPYAER